MSSYGGLYIGTKEVFSYRNGVPYECAGLFDQDDHVVLTGRAVYEFNPARFSREPTEDEYEYLEFHGFRASAKVIAERLDVLGYSETFAKLQLEKYAQETIANHERFASEGEGQLDEYSRQEIERASRFSYVQMKKEIAAFFRDLRAGDRVHAVHNDGPLKEYEYVDELVLLRAIVAAVPGDESLILDVSELFEGGWTDGCGNDVDDSGLSTVKNWSRPILLTEGSFDAEVIQAALLVRKPHLAGYIRFLDYEMRNDGGAAAVVRTVKSFAAAGILNRIVAIVDNDSAARETLIDLERVRLPPNIRVVRYPDIDMARSYPTIGPQGNVSMDVNRLAGSIELYLGEDVLRDDGAFVPVHWSGYQSRVKAYQGAVARKSEIQRRFREKVGEAQKVGVVRPLDWNELDALLKSLIETLASIPPFYTD